MKIVITAATALEWQGINEQINPLYTGESLRFNVSFHQSGVGLLASTFSLSKLILQLQPDLVIQVGIAGTFDERLINGTVVAVKNEFLGDTGVEEKGRFKDIFDLKLEDKNEFPFNKKALVNEWLPQYNLLKLKEVNGVTVNEVTTRKERVEQLANKYAAEVESMEGAALHYLCLQTATPFIQIRAVSNQIGERNKANWDIPLALNNLQSTVLKYLDKLYKQK